MSYTLTKTARVQTERVSKVPVGMSVSGELEAGLHTVKVGYKMMLHGEGFGNFIITTPVMGIIARSDTAVMFKTKTSVYVLEVEL